MEISAESCDIREEEGLGGGGQGGKDYGFLVLFLGKQWWTTHLLLCSKSIANKSELGSAVHLKDDFTI